MEMRDNSEDHVGREKGGSIGWDIWRGDGGNVGAQNLELERGKECTLVRRGGQTEVPGWIRSDESANKSDVKAGLLRGGRVGKKLWDSQF